MTESMERSERVLVKYPLFKTAIARIQACFDSHDATAEPDCCPIVGERKTTIISYFSSGSLQDISEFLCKPFLRNAL
jgi:hypothetical protein